VITEDEATMSEIAAGPWWRARAIHPAWFDRLVARGPIATWCATNVVVGALYVACGLAVANFFAVYGLFPAPIWLPASIALGAAVLGGVRVAPGIFIGSFIDNYALFDPPFHMAAMISFGNAVGPIAGALLMACFARAKDPFGSLRDLLAFLGFGVATHAAITATMGTLALYLSTDLPLQKVGQSWSLWWVSDAGGTLYFAPALLLWLMAMPRRDNRGDLMEGVVVSLLTLFAALLVFTDGPWQHVVRMEIPFMLTLPLSWLTLRFSLRSAYTLFTAVVMIATAGTVAGGGPFNMAGLDRPLTALSVLLVLLSSNMLLIAALLSEQRKAVQASRAKSSFLATMSHELRTPLNAMMGFADAIKSGLYGPPGHPKYAEYAGHIRDSGQHLLSLINDLLDLARIEAGRSELNLTAVDLHRAAEETVASMEGLTAAGGAVIKVEGRSGSAVAKGDARAVRQILLNLLSNVVKYSPSGGRVTVATAGGVEFVGFTVRDEGPGMTEEELKTALEPFGRINGPQAMRENGTGLDLPIAVALVESMGGELTITSRKGRGTAVTVTLPPFQSVLGV
jgi:two-component system cell cycle sensor histidine kinase PleC